MLSSPESKVVESVLKSFTVCVHEKSMKIPTINIPRNTGPCWSYVPYHWTLGNAKIFVNTSKLLAESTSILGKYQVEILLSTSYQSWLPATKQTSQFP